MSAPGQATARDAVPGGAPDDAAPGGGSAHLGSSVETATVRGALRRGRVWIVLAAIALLGVGAIAWLQGGVRGAGEPLGADNPAPAGAKALVEVLRQQGVEVESVSTLDDAVRGAGDGATVLLHDAIGLLDPTAVTELADSAERLVVVAPDFATLSELDAGVRLAGTASGPLESPGCQLPAAENAGELSDGQRLLSLDQAAIDAGWEGCFGDDGAFAVVRGPSAGGEIALVGATTAFANDTIDEAGNAALALGLTGRTDRLVWYLPGFDDLDPTTAPSITDLTPGWVSPVVVLLIVVVVAAAVWRGRRFGPLVVEDLPVEVPASETREGRARLYARSAVRAHALDQLRIGAAWRIGAILRLPRSASVFEIAQAAAGATGRDPRAVGHLLVDAVPAGDAELVSLAAALTELEDAVRRSVRPDDQHADGRTSASRHPEAPGDHHPDQTGDPSGRRS